MERVSAPGFAASEILAKGRESAARLHAMLDQQQLPEISTMPHELQDLVEQILHCCDRALAALNGSMGKKRKPERGGPADLPSTTRSKRLRYLTINLVVGHHCIFEFNTKTVEY